MGVRLGEIMGPKNGFAELTGKNSGGYLATTGDGGERYCRLTGIDVRDVDGTQGRDHMTNKPTQHNPKRPNTMTHSQLPLPQDLLSNACGAEGHATGKHPWRVPWWASAGGGSGLVVEGSRLVGADYQ
jgi:hypothetical protein